ncbi:leucyl/phenylalanyl-tRNA--protein transferase [Aestuariirhabdus sp. LZHN29]|uniref:leucyl/phenylalanyl-tRNA--protein transferase n=1 Tax=Aestuariirhabdus sp. LZHN29 TaxID=3417462 RepID=UPI003CECE11C
MPRLPWLDEKQVIFPPIDTALSEPNGLLAAGGNLHPQTILSAYRQGIFPWFSPGEPILWWSPSPRCVLLPSKIHISKSLQKVLRQKRFKITVDRAFPAVMKHCAASRNYTDQTWITPEMYDAYCNLHTLGHAHSIECWQQGELVGGLYGIAIGKVFFGESMFSLVSNASKIALVHLCAQLERWQFQLIDCQVESPHLRSLGASSMGREEFHEQLNKFANPYPTGAESERPTLWKLDGDYNG